LFSKIFIVLSHFCVRVLSINFKKAMRVPRFFLTNKATEEQIL
jgi:hypothetical protein